MKTLSRSLIAFALMALVCTLCVSAAPATRGTVEYENIQYSTVEEYGPAPVVATGPVVAAPVRRAVYAAPQPYVQQHYATGYNMGPFIWILFAVGAIIIVALLVVCCIAICACFSWLPFWQLCSPACNWCGNKGCGGGCRKPNPRC